MFLGRIVFNAIAGLFLVVMLSELVTALPAQATPADVTFEPSENTCSPMPDFKSLPCGSVVDATQCDALRTSKQAACQAISASGVWYNRLLEFLLPKIENNLFELFATLLVLALAASTAFFKRVSARLGKRIGDPFFKRSVSFENHGLNIIVVGEGKSGKTTIIHTLSGSDDANPEVSTDEYATYTLVHEINVVSTGRNKRDVYRLYFDDYVGQRFDSAVNNPLLDLRRKVIPASVLMIVVDVFLDRPPANGVFDLKRIREQNDFYTNEGILQILIRLLGSGKQIILFINKIDMAVAPPNINLSELAKEKYKPIIDALSRIRGKQLSVIAGSAKTGQGVVGYDGGIDSNRSLFKVILDATETFNGWDPA